MSFQKGEIVLNLSFIHFKFSSVENWIYVNEQHVKCQKMSDRTTAFSAHEMYVCTDVCMDVGFSSTSKGKPLLSNEKAMTVFRQTWYVGSGGGGTSTTHVVCCHWTRLTNTSFAYLFWMANNKKSDRYPEFCMGYIDVTWYVGSDGHKHYPCSVSSPNEHI